MAVVEAELTESFLGGDGLVTPAYAPRTWRHHVSRSSTPSKAQIHNPVGLLMQARVRRRRGLEPRSNLGRDNSLRTTTRSGYGSDREHRPPPRSGRLQRLSLPQYITEPSRIERSTGAMVNVSVSRRESWSRHWDFLSRHSWSLRPVLRSLPGSDGRSWQAPSLPHRLARCRPSRGEPLVSGRVA